MNISCAQFNTYWDQVSLPSFSHRRLVSYHDLHDLQLEDHPRCKQNNGFRPHKASRTKSWVDFIEAGKTIQAVSTCVISAFLTRFEFNPYLLNDCSFASEVPNAR